MAYRVLFMQLVPKFFGKQTNTKDAACLYYLFVHFRWNLFHNFPSQGISNFQEFCKPKKLLKIRSQRIRKGCFDRSIGITVKLSRVNAKQLQNGIKKKPHGSNDQWGLKYKFGDDLLSRCCSTISADRLNFSVRNGKRWGPVAKITKRFLIS